MSKKSREDNVHFTELFFFFLNAGIMIKQGYEFIKNYSLNHCSDDIVIVMDNTLKIR